MSTLTGALQAKIKCFQLKMESQTKNINENFEMD